MGVSIYPDLDAWSGITCMVVRLNMGLLALAIIDTGAVTCIIGRAGMELVRGRDIRTEGEKPRLLLASGERLEVKGAIDVEMIVGRRTDVSRFFIVEQFSGDFLLGTDFLRDRKAVVDFRMKTMTWTTFANQEIKAKIETGDKSGVVKKIDEHNSRWMEEKRARNLFPQDRLMASITRPEERKCEVEKRSGEDSIEDVGEGWRW